LAGETLAVTHLHIITVNAFAPGTPIIVVQVIPAPHGERHRYVTDAMEARTHESKKTGREVGLVCTDGDSTFVNEVGSRVALLAAPGNYRLELPVHMQGEFRVKNIISDTRATSCHGIDQQGKILHDLITKGRSVTVFQRFSHADVAFDVDGGILRGLGVPTAALRGSVAGKMDDHLAATLFSGDDLVMTGNPLRQSVASFRGMPLGDGASEHDRAANGTLRAEVERVR
jgi:hypothetical protein